VLGYVGSVGTWYLFDEVVTAFRQLRELRPDARLLVINRNDHAYVRDRLQAGGVPLEAVEIRGATHAEVPAQMARMHAGIFFIKPVFSKQASAPTKLGEFLGCGIPCLANAGVGDMAEILETDRVGVAIADFEPATIRAGMARLLALVADPDASSRCVSSAQAHFSLDEGVRRYQAVYRSLEARP
jgi:glycosyltransferase involved in cell wall biosynthesis